MSMVKNKNLTTDKLDYRKAVLEIIEFSAEDIVTASETAQIVPNEKGDNLSSEEDDYYWWN